MNVAKNVTSGANGRSAVAVPTGRRLGAAVRPKVVDLADIAVGHGPIRDIAVSPDGTEIVVANSDDTISFVDPHDLAERMTVVLAGELLAIAVADDLVYAATTSAAYDAIWVIDADSAAIVASYPLELSITAICADAGRIVAGRTGRGRTDLAIIDTTTGAVGAVDLARAPGAAVDAVRVSRDGTRLYAAVSGVDSGELRVISGSRVLVRVAIGAPIRDIAVSPDGNIVYVLACGAQGGSLQVIDTRGQRVVSSVEIGGWPTQMALNPDGSRVHVVDGDDVLEVCTVTHRIVDALRVGGQPSGVATGYGRLYVADYAGTVTALGTSVPLQAVTVAPVRELQPAV